MSDSEAKSDPEVTDNTQISETAPVALPPPKLTEGGYGWVVVTATALLNAHTWGLNSSFAVFLAYYLRNNSIEGASSLGFAFVGGLSISISLLISPLATILAGLRSFGTRKTIFLGTIFETIAFIGASFTSALWHLVLTQGICFGVGMGLIFVSSVPVPSQWFAKRRSLANAVAAGGSGFGGLTYSLATNAMISHIGLAWTFRVLAIICFVVNTICSYLVRDRNDAVGSVTLALNWQLFRRPQYLMYQGWMFFCMIPYVGLVFSIVDYSQSVGLSASQASLIGALLNLSQGIGRPIIGLSSDKVGRLNVAGFGTAFCGVLCVTLWVFSKSLATCIVFALLVGGVAGVMWAAAAPVLAEVIGLQLLPSGLSMTWLVLVLPSTFAEVIVLEIRSRSYRGAQLFIGFMYLMAFACVWSLRAWKVREIRHAQLTEKQRERAIRDDDAAPHRQPGDEEEREAPIRRVASIASTARKGFQWAQGLWAWERV